MDLTVSEALGVFAVYLFFSWLIFRGIFMKASYSQWATVVPIYNWCVIFRLAAVSRWMILLLVIPLANLLTYGFLFYRISKNFGKSHRFSMGAACLPFVFLPIISYDRSTYAPVTRSFAASGEAMH
jgi:hypothetical protein